MPRVMPKPNPYAPPRSDDAAPEDVDGDGRPRYKLYSPRHIGIATFLGTPLGGLFVHSLNLRRRGQGVAATNAVLVGAGLTAAMILIGFVLPEAVGRALPIAAVIGIMQYAKREEPLFLEHLHCGGQAESGWKAAGIGLLSAIVVLMVLVPLVLLFQ